MSDELDQLTDAALSERVAVECAGFKRFDIGGGGVVWKDAEGAVAVPRYRQHFATSADAVLPLLKEWCASTASSEALASGVVVQTWGNGYHVSAFAPTFARAACIALLRAKRAEKGGAK